MNSWYICGIAVGIIISVLLVVGILMFINKDKSLKTVFDERQSAARGFAYKVGFFTLFIEMFIAAFLESIGNHLFTSFDGMVTLALVGMVVFVIVCIVKDAYVGLNEQPKKTFSALFIIGLSNYVISQTASQEPIGIVDGRFSMSINLQCAICLMIIIVVYVIRIALLKRNGGDEEE